MSKDINCINQLIKLLEEGKVIVRVPAQISNNFFASHVEVIDASKLIKILRKGYTE